MNKYLSAATLVACAAAVTLVVVAEITFAAIFWTVVIVLAVLALAGAGAHYVHSWQVKRLPIRADRREQERHTQELELARERHTAELHLLYTRVPFDQNGNAPILLNLPDTHVTMLPPGQLPQRSPSKDKAPEPGPVEQKPVPEPVDVYDLLMSGKWAPRKDKLLIAAGTDGLLQVSMGLAWHIALAGSTGNGKTNLLRLLLPQLVKMAQVYYISPAFAPVKANGEDWRPIAAHLAGPVAVDASEIAERLSWAVAMYEDRAERERAGDFSWQDEPCYIVIDEFIKVKELYPDAPDLVVQLLKFARQYGVFVILAAQDFLLGSIGGDSGARECFRTCIYAGGDAHTARKLLDIAGTLPYEAQLGNKGLVAVKSKEIPLTLARVPLMSNEALYELLGQGLPGTAGDFSGTGPTRSTGPLDGNMQAPARVLCRRRISRQLGPVTGDLQNVVEADVEPSGTGPVKALDGKRFTPEQELRFTRLYRERGNIKEVLRAMRLGNAYGAYARQVVDKRGLRKS